MTSARLPCCRITLLALLPALACSQSPPVQPVAGRDEVRSSRAADLRDTKALLLLMADQKRFEATVFVALLDSSASVRTDLAVALGRIGDPRGRGLLQGLLIDVEPQVRRAAAFALGELEFPADVAAPPTPPTSASAASSASSAISALLRASVDDDAETGALAVEALGKLQAPLADVRRTLTALAPDAAARRLAPALFRFREDAMVEVAVELARGARSSAPPVASEPAAPSERSIGGSGGALRGGLCPLPRRPHRGLAAPAPVARGPRAADPRLGRARSGRRGRAGGLRAARTSPAGSRAVAPHPGHSRRRPHRGAGAGRPTPRLGTAPRQTRRRPPARRPRHRPRVVRAVDPAAGGSPGRASPLRLRRAEGARAGPCRARPGGRFAGGGCGSPRGGRYRETAPGARGRGGRTSRTR